MSTDISQLPFQPNETNNNNIQLETSENVKIENNIQNIEEQRNNDPAIQQKDLNNLVTDIQQASAAGQTRLPSRDIPSNNEHLVKDPEIKPNYIPPPQEEDYIKNYENNESIIMENKKKQEKKDNMEVLYEEFQLPILLAIIYFLFQLPVIKKNLYKFIPMLFDSDGNHNIYGYLFTSVMFALSYYVLNKFVIKVSYI